MASKSPMTAAREFFGLKEGQTGLQFGKEYNELSYTDKVEVRHGIASVTGWDIDPVKDPVSIVTASAVAVPA